MYAPQKISIKAWAEDDRPREKLLGKGRHVLSDAELLAIILGSGSRDESAVELAKRILLSAGNNVDQLAKMNVRELQKFRGVGEAKAIGVVAAFELGRRRKNTAGEKKDQVNSSADAYRIILPHVMDLPHEEFWLLLLNRSNVVTHKKHISTGGISSTIVDPKIVFRTAIENSASQMVLCHNHPSGAVKPSESDIRLTRRLHNVAELLDITLLDHIIVGADQYYSFADEGML